MCYKLICITLSLNTLCSCFQQETSKKMTLSIYKAQSKCNISFIIFTDNMSFIMQSIIPYFVPTMKTFCKLLFFSLVHFSDDKPASLLFYFFTSA
ncbi:hypothetical protein HOLleu_05705 [Holothuria leucospilota]|uniref:Secreted protein n=1 Tax=Holothuria leucospilota TaxID=206669 RepID=A0A9Q1CJY5_HOLLE|nr:hypothetical protein HOLleu_05705 [Holothuria leucospilota]